MDGFASLALAAEYMAKHHGELEPAGLPSA